VFEQDAMGRNMRYQFDAALEFHNGCGEPAQLVARTREILLLKDMNLGPLLPIHALELSVQ
jgi:hypothetical protein